MSGVLIVNADDFGLTPGVSRGILEAHRRGIVHRDVKPENLFITRDGRIKVLGFALAMHYSISLSRLAEQTKRLADAHIVTDARPGHVRISPYFYNVRDDHRAAIEDRRNRGDLGVAFVAGGLLVLLVGIGAFVAYAVLS